MSAFLTTPANIRITIPVIYITPIRIPSLEEQKQLK
jgi:hypothetical protein